MDGPAGPALDVIWQKDVHEPGKATCPKCGLLRGYGTAGVINLVKKHLDKEIRKDTKKKQDKEPRKNGSLNAFFKEKTAPIATFLKSTVRAPSPIRGAGISAKKIPLPAETYPRPAAAKPDTPSSRVIQLLDHLRANVELLPSTIPDADVDNPLSGFAAEPTEYVSQSMPAGELWEALSPTFHRVFGYGMGPDERKRMVQRGSAGLDGILRSLDYFICERGLEGGMVELKIEQLIEAVQSVLQENDAPAIRKSSTEKKEHYVHLKHDAPLDPIRYQRRMVSSMSCELLTCGATLQFPRTHILFSLASFAPTITRQDIPTAEGYPHTLITLCERSFELLSKLRANQKPLYLAVEELTEMAKAKHADTDLPLGDTAGMDAAPSEESNADL
ncbi:hypothetical protein B0H14DRAFT_3770845 [Mycena olivaceomarginata]|nr:hypothetical protein B0H14DRAFT_3770845 [Mycena olivaceomarginata]